MPLQPDLKKYRADLVRNVVLVIAYVVFARLGLFFSIGEGNISTIWLPAGIAAAAILVFGPRILPGVWLGEVIGNLYTGLSPSILVFYGLGNVAEAWIFYTIVHRTSGTGPFYCRLSGVAGFALGTGVACIAAAVAGVSTLYTFGGILPGEFAGNVVIWWVGDVIGILVATPLIIAWSRPSVLKFPRRYLAEYGLFYVALVFTAYFIFSTWFSPAITRGMPYLVLIFIVWAVFRLGERHVTAASALAGVFAVRAVITGTGPFSGQTLPIQLFTTEGFIAITSITGIILIAVVAERRSVDEELRKSRDDLEERVNARTEELSRDIARRVSAEEALKQSERRLADIIDFIPDAVLVIDRNGTVITWNRAMEELTGYSAERMVGKGNYEYAIPFYGKRRPILADMIFLPDARVHDAYPEVVRRRGDVLVAEVTLTRPGGKRQVLWGNASPVYGAKGEIAGAIESIRDITEMKEIEEALMQSHALLEEALDQAHMAYWEYDVATELFTFNDRFYALYGTTAAQEGGYTMPAEVYARTFMHPEDAGLVSREVNNAISAPDPGYFSEIQHRIIRRDGELRYVVVRIRITKDSGGRTIKTHGVNQDVTERATAEAALKQSNFLLEQALDQARMAYWEYDVTTGLFTFNDRFYALYGTTATQEGGYTMPAEVYARTFMHPEDASLVSREVNNAISAPDPGYFSEIQHRIIRRDGELRYVVVRIRIVKDSEGRTIRTYGANQDITDLKTAEIALKKSNYLLEEALDQARMAYWEADSSTGAFIFNDRFYALFGTTATREGGFRMRPEVYARELMHPDDAGLVAAEVTKAMQATAPNYYSEIEHRILRRDGETRYVIVRLRVSRGSDGRTTRIRGSIQDITDRKRAELALQAVNRKLNLLSGITRHDIINQVTALRGYLELSHEITMVPELAGFIEKEEQIAEAIERQILFTRDYQDMGVKTPLWQDVRKTIADAMSGLPLRTCTVEVMFHGLEVYADPLLEKVFFNLIDNALRYGGPKMTNIRFSAHRSGHAEVIVCEDDGEGIAIEDKKHLFERGHGRHTGLGLFLSREILAITGITIHETSGEGTGARFEITVPDGAYRWADEKGA